MFLTLLGRSILDFSSKDGCGRYEILGESLAAMVKEVHKVQISCSTYICPSCHMYPLIIVFTHVLLVNFRRVSAYSDWGVLGKKMTHVMDT